MQILLLGARGLRRRPVSHAPSATAFTRDPTTARDEIINNTTSHRINHPNYHQRTSLLLHTPQRAPFILASRGQARLFHIITACRRSLSILRPYYLPSSFACFLHASFVLPPPIAAAIRDHLSGVSGPIFATAAFSFASSAAVQLALPLPGADGGVAAALPAAANFPAGVPPFAAAFGGGSGALFAFFAAAGGGAAAAGRFFPAAAPFGGGGSSSDSSSLSPSSSNSSSSSSSSSSCCVCVRWA